MEVSPYLLFNGSCAEAFKLYEKVLGGKIVGLMTHGESPASGQVPPEWRSKVMHVRLEAHGAVLMGSDAPPEHYERPQGFSVSLSVDTPEETDRIFNALVEGGKVQMPVQKTFWSIRFGMLVDRFGIPWIVNCNQAA